MKIIFAQGNPDKKHSKTRHNVGFMVLDALAEQHQARWSNDAKFQANTTHIELAGEKVVLVKPNTYYNSTGSSAKSIISYYKLNPAKDLLVIHDDIALPFGKIRVRDKGSDGGNNGIKSINQHVGLNYFRIRIGTHNYKCDRIEDAKFVLSKFNITETHNLKKFILPASLKLAEMFASNKLKTGSLDLKK